MLHEVHCTCVHSHGPCLCWLVCSTVLQAVYEWNKQAPAKGQAQSMRVLLGGSEVLNSDMFLKALGAA